MPKPERNVSSRRRWLASSLLFASVSLGVRFSAAAASPELAPVNGRFAFRTYAEEEGLGNLTIECLLQDRTGFLWVGTQDGLFRFDGSRFVRFSREEGLPSTRINCLHETADGRLYAGTRSGLARRVGDRFRPIGPAEGLPDSSIPDEGIASDRDHVFVAMPTGLYLGSNDRFRLEPRADGGKEVPVSGVHVDPQGALYFGRKGMLARRVAGVTEDFGRTRGIPETETIDQTATDAEGALWVRSLKAIYRLRRGEDRFVDLSSGLAAGVSSGRLERDREGRILVPTQRGLARTSPTGWETLGRSRGLETDTVLSALVDREGSLWVGTAGVGLSQQLGRGTFTSWGAPEGLPHDVVWSIVRERLPSASLWVGTQEGVARFDAGGAVAVFREGDGLGGNTVYALAATEDGSVWAGSWPGGVTRFGPERGRVRGYASKELPASELRVAALFVDGDGTLWAGARSGLYRLDPRGKETAFEKISSPPGGEEPDSVFGIARAASPGGALCAVGRFGLQVFGAQPRRYRAADGLKSDFLASIVAEPGGGLVAGYREALGAERVSLTAEGGRLSHRLLDRSSGLTADKVILVGRDARGSLWIGSGSGVDVLAADQSRPTHFGRSSGLISEDLDQNAFFAEPDETVWLGTSRGLVRYHPGPATSLDPVPPVLVTEATAGSRRLDPQARAPARLSRDERTVHLSWAGLTFVDPRRVRYRYRLSGLDEAFTETAMTEARFPALSSGDYVFEVLAISAAGVPSKRPAVLAFRVAPAWWERWWARGAAAAALLLLGLATVRVRTRALEADRTRLEAAVAARSSELAAANRELEEASTTDPLTKLRNRRYFSMVIEEDARRAQRAYRPADGRSAAPDHRDLIFYVLDLDHFKSVNDRFGHDAGDRVLMEAASRLRRVARQSDLVMRWGGEEFLIVSRDAERGNGAVLARRLLEALAAERFETGEGEAVPLTGSVGWACYPWIPEAPDAYGHDDVLRVADRALYAAKAGGRNRAVAATAAPLDDALAERAGALVYRLTTTQAL